MFQLNMRCPISINWKKMLLSRQTIGWKCHDVNVSIRVPLKKSYCFFVGASWWYWSEPELFSNQMASVNWCRIIMLTTVLPLCPSYVQFSTKKRCKNKWYEKETPQFRCIVCEENNQVIIVKYTEEILQLCNICTQYSYSLFFQHE